MIPLLRIAERLLFATFAAVDAFFTHLASPAPHVIPDEHDGHLHRSALGPTERP